MERAASPGELMMNGGVQDPPGTQRFISEFRYFFGVTSFKIR